MSKTCVWSEIQSARWRFPPAPDYGIHTARAVENFPITGILLRHYPELVQSLAMVKKAAAMANRELGHAET